MRYPSRRDAGHLRPRSTAAVVLSRTDASVFTEPATAPAPAGRERRWPTVVVWVMLGAAIAGAWALLLLGDSLQTVSG